MLPFSKARQNCRGLGMPKHTAGSSMGCDTPPSSQSRNLLKNVLADFGNNMNMWVDDFGDVVSDGVCENGGDLSGIQAITSSKPLRKAARCCLHCRCK